MVDHKYRTRNTTKPGPETQEPRPLHNSSVTELEESIADLL